MEDQWGTILILGDFAGLQFRGWCSMKQQQICLTTGTNNKKASGTHSFKSHIKNVRSEERNQKHSGETGHSDYPITGVIALQSVWNYGKIGYHV